MDMTLFIHTYGRVGKQETLKTFNTELRKRTVLVVQAREEDRWKLAGVPEHVRLMVLPDQIRMLSPTRQFILDHAVQNGLDKIVMMDDDLKFSFRQPGGLKLFAAVKTDVENMFGVLEDALDEHVHAGVSAREGNNRQLDDYTRIGRMMRVLAYRPKAVHDLDCRFDRLRTKQDFDMTLQLLRKGKPNYITFRYAQDQGGSQAEGGCATYRTPEMMSEDAMNLHNLHPDFVKVVTKTTKGAWGGGARIDVNIQWKRAFESSGVLDTWRQP